MNGFDFFSFGMIAIFAIGYLLIAFEHTFQINKTTTALMMGVLLWILQFSDRGVSSSDNIQHLSSHLANASQVIIFLLGALIIVEIINTHQGFKLLTDKLQVSSKRIMLWIIGLATFFLSSILDNLTTTIVMVSIIQKIIEDPKDRLLIGGGIVIAANAGGAWTPIGDVTTTMLWIGERITSLTTLRDLFLPSLSCFVVAFACITPMLKGNFSPVTVTSDDDVKEPHSTLFLILGVSALVFVPIFKNLTGLPPFMGMIFGLSVLWFVTDLLHRNESEREHLKVMGLLPKIDIAGPLFFLGILLAVNALETAGLLTSLAQLLKETIASPTFVATTLGLASSVIDNIPLVAASMGMYPLSEFPIDSHFWQLIAYCAGTGGSILIIGSAAGVVFMGLEKVDFFDYFKKMSLAATLGYFAGIATYLLLN